MGKLKDLFKRKKANKADAAPETGENLAAQEEGNLKTPETTIEELTKKANDGWSKHIRERAQQAPATVTTVVAPSKSLSSGAREMNNPPAAIAIAGEDKRIKAPAKRSEHGQPFPEIETLQERPKLPFKPGC